MKKTIFSILGLLIMGFISAQSINNATIKTSVKGDNFDGYITWFLKGDKLAFDVEFSHEDKTYLSRFIPDKAKGIFHILTNTPEAKIYSTAEAKSINHTPGFDPIVISVTEEGQEVISGINCTKIVVKTAGTITECYIDPTINAQYASYEAFFRSDYALLAMKELKLNGFPIALKTTDLDGKVLTEMKTINIQTNSVNDNAFKIDKEYKTVEELNKLK